MKNVKSVWQNFNSETESSAEGELELNISGDEFENMSAKRKKRKEKRKNKKTARKAKRAARKTARKEKRAARRGGGGAEDEVSENLGQEQPSGEISQEEAQQSGLGAPADTDTSGTQDQSVQQTQDDSQQQEPQQQQQPADEGLDADTEQMAGMNGAFEHATGNTKYKVLTNRFTAYGITIGDTINIPIVKTIKVAGSNRTLALRMQGGRIMAEYFINNKSYRKIDYNSLFSLVTPASSIVSTPVTSAPIVNNTIYQEPAYQPSYQATQYSSQDDDQVSNNDNTSDEQVENEEGLDVEDFSGIEGDFEHATGNAMHKKHSVAHRAKHHKMNILKYLKRHFYRLMKERGDTTTTFADWVKTPEEAKYRLAYKKHHGFEGEDLNCSGADGDFENASGSSTHKFLKVAGIGLLIGGLIYGINKLIKK